MDGHFRWVAPRLRRIVVLTVMGLLVPVASAFADDTPRITERPTISGDARVGASLTASAAWEPATGVPSYQWQRCDPLTDECGPIAGATGQTYTVVAADAGQRLAVRLTVTWGKDTRSRTSELTSVVPEPSGPVLLSPPSILGTAVQGSEVSADSGVWSDSSGLTLSYAWLRCDVSGGGCESIPSATGDTYVLTADDVDHTLRVVVTATDASGSVSVTSGPTSTVVAAPPAAPPPSPPVNETPPGVVGLAQAGETVVAAIGGWSGDGPFAFTFAWLRCAASCEPIAGADAQSYAIGSSDVGYTLEVSVTATTPAGSTTVESAPTATVAPLPSVPPVPSPAPTPTATPAPAATPTPTPAATTLSSATSAASGSTVPEPPASAPAPAATALPLMRPFPVVRIAGRYDAMRTRVTLATVRAPRGARIVVRCRGGGCAAPRRAWTARFSSLRLLERSYRPGAVIEVRVTRSGSIGKYVKVTMRSGRPPARQDLCVATSASPPFPCPGG